MKAIASSFLVLAAALFWQSSVQLPESSNGIKYFGILLSVVLIWFGLAGFWRSWSPEEREK